MTKKILVSAGHSSSDPGAVGQGTTEAAICLAFRDAVAVRLSGIFSVTVVTDSDKRDRNLKLREAIAIALKTTIAVEFHCNASANPTATGVEVLYGAFAGADKRYFAGHLSSKIADTLDLRDRGAKPDTMSAHKTLGFCRAGGLVVELFFLSNTNDYKKYKDKESALATVVANSILDFVI